MLLHGFVVYSTAIDAHDKDDDDITPLRTGMSAPPTPNYGHEAQRLEFLDQ
jgi:hypothetical protein